MPTSLIDELQLDAANPAVSTSSLLRKALMVAAKLELSDVPEWINAELSGYRNEESTPSYRTVYGDVRARGLRGWLHVQFPTTDLHDMVAKYEMRESVAELEALRAQDGRLASGFPPECQQLLQNLFQESTEFVRFLERSRIDGILDEIRNRVLRWAIALDKAGVRGNGLTFSAPEKEKAHAIVFHVNGGIVTIGTVGSGEGHANAPVGHAARVNIRSEDSSTNSVTIRASDMPQLAVELAKLRAALLPLARDPEHYAAIGAIASAEISAKEGKPSKVRQALSTLGSGAKWALGAARDIGVHLAEAALKTHLGLP
jgi:hypothetical protein